MRPSSYPLCAAMEAYLVVPIKGFFSLDYLFKLIIYWNVIALAVSELLANAEIYHVNLLHLAIPPQQDVLRLDVPVDHGSAMDVFNYLNQLIRQLDHRFQTELPKVLQMACQISSQ